jgi:hypothetical protein
MTLRSVNSTSFFNVYWVYFSLAQRTFRTLSSPGITSFSPPGSRDKDSTAPSAYYNDYCLYSFFPFCRLEADTNHTNLQPAKKGVELTLFIVAGQP